MLKDYFSMSLSAKFIINCPCLSIKLEEKLNLCKYDLDEKNRVLTKLSSDADQRLRNSFSQPNRLNFASDTHASVADLFTKERHYKILFFR